MSANDTSTGFKYSWAMPIAGRICPNEKIQGASEGCKYTEIAGTAKYTHAEVKGGE